MEEVEHLVMEHPGVPQEVGGNCLSGLPMVLTELGL